MQSSEKRQLGYSAGTMPGYNAAIDAAGINGTDFPQQTGREFFDPQQQLLVQQAAWNTLSDLGKQQQPLIAHNGMNASYQQQVFPVEQTATYLNNSYQSDNGGFRRDKTSEKSCFIPRPGTVHKRLVTDYDSSDILAASPRTKRRRTESHESATMGTNCALLMLAEATSGVEDAHELTHHAGYQPQQSPLGAPFGIEAATAVTANYYLPSDASWDAHYQLIEAFHAKYGHCVVPPGWKDHPELPEWLEMQRLEGGKLMQQQNSQVLGDAAGLGSAIMHQRMAKLNRLGFEWTAPESWDDMMQKVKAFFHVHGHSNVPKRYKEDPKLAHWADKQRELYRQRQEGLETPLTDERIQTLTMFGFKFEVGQANHETFDGMFEKLLDYFAKHGHCNVPDKSKEYPKLGRWLRMQRRHYKLLKEGAYSSLTEERIQKLNSINVQWNVKESWLDMFAKLQAFQCEHGHCNVPQKWKPNPKLGVWVHHQRRFYKLKLAGKYSTLTDDRIEQLNRIKFCWNSPDKNPYLFQMQVPMV
ncbi:hypothetical protein MPSEU_000990300 [Mayamaea pseudoterrestris]|nr:hypothetical protein MPSEU_000990300 [Mayamaea pseudoterrestris]